MDARLLQKFFPYSFLEIVLFGIGYGGLQRIFKG